MHPVYGVYISYLNVLFFITTCPVYKTLHTCVIYHERGAERRNHLSTEVPALLGELTPTGRVSAVVQHFSGGILVYIRLQRCTMSILSINLPIFNNLEAVLIYCIVQAVWRGKKTRLQSVYFCTFKAIERGFTLSALGFLYVVAFLVVAVIYVEMIPTSLCWI